MNLYGNSVSNFLLIWLWALKKTIAFETLIDKISDIVFNLSIDPEPFGRTTIEAISCGAKFIGLDHGGTKEILEELFPNGLVPLGNINALEEKVIKVSDKNYLTPKENVFTSERMINETINLYHQLLSTE